MTEITKKFNRKPKPTPQELGLKLIARCHHHELYLKTAVEIVEAGADIAIADEHGNTALMGCACWQSPAHKALAQVLIEKGAPLDAHTTRGTTALSWGICHGNTDVVLGLIEAGCRTDICEDNNRSPLHLAAERGHAVMVEALIKAGANLDLQDKFGYTPFNLLCSSAHDGERIEATARLLVEAGADYRIADNFHRSPYDRLNTNLIGAGLRYPGVLQLIVDHATRVQTEKIDGVIRSLTQPSPHINQRGQSRKLKRK